MLADHLRTGTGEPVLMLHGFTATWRVWGPLPGQLGRHAEVLAPTLPGHTGGPALGDGKSVPLLVEWLEALLDDTGWRTAHLVGFSLGGWLAFELARRGRARTVTAVSPGGATTERDALESRRIKTVFAASRAAAKALGPGMDALCARPRGRRLAVRDQMRHGERLTPAECRGFVRDFVATPVFDRFLGEIGAGPGLTDLGAVDVPVTVLWGEHDRVLPQRKHEPVFRRMLPGASYRTLRDAGHVPFWDAPDPIVDAALEHVRAPRRTTPVG